MFSNGKCIQSMYKVFAPQDNFLFDYTPRKTNLSDQSERYDFNHIGYFYKGTLKQQQPAVVDININIISMDVFSKTL